VIEKEEPPFEFKIHLFLDQPEEKQVSMQVLTETITKKLDTFEAKNIRDKLDNRKNPDKADAHERIRYTFEIHDKSQALKCYKFFSGYSNWQRNGYNKKFAGLYAKDEFNLKETLKIYLQKDESLFEKYGDEEAEKFE
jgi:hypothetical protein